MLGIAGMILASAVLVRVIVIAVSVVILVVASAVASVKRARREAKRWADRAEGTTEHGRASKGILPNEGGKR